MIVEIYVGSIIALIGIACALFPYVISDFFAASAYAMLSERRADDISRSQHPRTLRIVGVLFIAFGAFTAVSAVQDAARGADAAPPVGALIVGVIVACAGLGVLIFQKTLAKTAARRLRASGGDRFCGSDVDRYARIIIRVLAAWILLVACIPLLLGLTHSWR